MAHGAGIVSRLRAKHRRENLAEEPRNPLTLSSRSPALAVTGAVRYTLPMIIVMKSDIGPESPEVQQVIKLAARYPGVHAEVRQIEGATRSLTEIYLLGPTTQVPQEPFEEFPAVE